MNLIGLLVWLLVAIVIVWVAKYLLDVAEVPRPIRTVVLLIVALVLLLWLLGQGGAFGPRIVVF